MARPAPREFQLPAAIVSAIDETHDTANRALKAKNANNSLNRAKIDRSGGAQKLSRAKKDVLPVLLVALRLFVRRAHPCNVSLFARCLAIKLDIRRPFLAVAKHFSI